MGNGGLEWALYGSLLGIDMNPLMVEGSVGKQVDTLLREFHIVGNTKILAEHCGKILIIVDY